MVVRVKMVVMGREIEEVSFSGRDVDEDVGVVIRVVAGMVSRDIIGDGITDLELRVVVGLRGGEVVVFLWRDLVVVVGFRRWKWRWISMVKF